MKFDRLLAKSQRQGEPWRDSMLLHVHLRDVHTAAVEVLNSTADDQLSSLGLSPQQHRERFRRIVRTAAVFHDLGKANHHFQEMLRRLRRVQGIRHEWVTHLAMLEQAIHDWLRPSLVDDLELAMVHWAICGHHPAFGRPSPPREAVDGAGSELELLMGHSDFRECLFVIAEALGLSTPPSLQDLTLSLCGASSAFATVATVVRRASSIFDSLTEEEHRLVSAIKPCLIAADIAGSALPKAGKEMVWINEAFARRPSPEELHGIILDRLDGKSLRPFQRQVAESSNRVTFVRAGCGSGKTLAAYAWASQQCPGKRLYVCYPTTGTSTEGFRDYLFDDEISRSKAGARLFHGRASVDLDMLLGVRDEDEADSAARMESLDAWSTPIVSCTVDTVLGIIQNNRRGLYAWPALSGSAFVFDEIHSYDDELFGALLRFLGAVRGVRILLMTASLPVGRVQAILERLEMQGEALSEINGPADLEQLKRYRRLSPERVIDPLNEVQKEINRGGKVLWVCNTVDRAIDAANRASELRPLIYHSRFRYEDRVQRHSEVIEAFHKDGPALAICTQVAEMSLDLSATMLVTDLAPIPALIQRLGRLNRRAEPSDNPSIVMPFIIVEPTANDDKRMPLPYEQSDLVLAERWLANLGQTDLSQADLANAWMRLDQSDPAAACDSHWVDGGPVTSVRELRKASPGITVLLERDKAAVESGEKHLMQVAVPMPPPKGRDWSQWPRCKGLPVAPHNTINYDPRRGARWVK